MTLSQLMFTVFGALLGYAGKVIELYLIRPDSIKVDLGFPSGAYEDASQMDIQNFSPHRIKLRDFGFIKSDGSRFSLPEEFAASGYIDERIHYDKIELEARENLPAHFSSRMETIGAFAYTTAQKFPRLTFRHEISFITRYWIRIYIYLIFLRGRRNWKSCLHNTNAHRKDLL